MAEWLAIHWYCVSCDLIAVLWMDRDRRYFVSSAGTTLTGNYIRRESYTMVDGEARLVEKFIPIRSVAEDYYSACALVARHNRCRQNDLDMEKISHEALVFARGHLSALYDYRERFVALQMILWVSSPCYALEILLSVG